MTESAGDGKTTYTYDDAGNLPSVIDALGHQTTYA